LAPSDGPIADQISETRVDASNDAESESLMGQQALTLRGGAQIDQRDGLALSLFQQDRNFRLLRLANLFPRYMTPDQVTHFGSVTYRGQMVRDPSFVSRNPARPSTTRSTMRENSRYSGGSGGFGHGFGGGTSSGGRGGRF
ncbi:MAG: hypothetical protein SGARI_006816, partial [Bacillariaceae sp.]